MINKAQVVPNKDNVGCKQDAKSLCTFHARGYTPTIHPDTIVVPVGFLIDLFSHSKIALGWIEQCARPARWAAAFVESQLAAILGRHNPEWDGWFDVTTGRWRDRDYDDEGQR